MTTEIERGAFEKWMETSVDDYDDIGSETLFECWQAARAQQAGSEGPSETDQLRAENAKLRGWYNDAEQRLASAQRAGSGGAVATLLGQGALSPEDTVRLVKLPAGTKLHTHPSASVPSRNDLLAALKSAHEKRNIKYRSRGDYLPLTHNDVVNVVMSLLTAAPQPAGDGWVRYHDDGSILGYSQHYGKWLLLRYGNDHPMNSPKPTDQGNKNE